MKSDHDNKYGAFQLVCETLQAGHRKGSDTPEATLNRLFRKHLSGWKLDLAQDPSWLSEGTVEVLTEHWNTDDLWELVPKIDNPRKPRKIDRPLVMVRYRGQDCLIDGGSRVRHWHAQGDQCTHPVWVLVPTPP